MRICWICQNFNAPYASGEIRMFFNLLSRIPPGRVEVHVITNSSPSPNEIQGGNFTIHGIAAKRDVDPLNFISALRFYLQGSRLFLQLHKTLGFDILQMVGSFPVLGLYVALLAKAGGCKSVWGFIGFPLGRAELKGFHRKLRDRPRWYQLFTSPAMFWLLGRLWSRWLDGIIVASQVAFSLLRDIGVEGRKISLIPPGVDLEMFRPRDTARHLPYRIIYVSSCYPWKGVFDLLDAFKTVLDRGASAELLYVFPSIQSELVFIAQLERRIVTLGLRDRVVIRAGPMNEIEDVIAQADVLACPLQNAIQTVDIPMSLLEGMACGLPVIGTSVGGIPEAILDGVNGYLVEPSAPDAMAGAIVKMLEDPLRLEKMGQESLRMATAFDVRRNAPLLWKTYAALAGQTEGEGSSSASGTAGLKLPRR